ncbi:hypothetical protein DXV75_13975 [Alteromonas aestuariivivens]|uniref:Uncharacterized protein n=1 Tax=Alteromonas aestuariivivens TaxID=1938339 RepID=A0A3D8M4Q1_9ALTE|nr:hypothetical protein [Alteromonas aestuariivivens]RDV24525.1 hypothetical protein DXV75_13975 [Alteromonas aestuariivivens]
MTNTVLNSQLSSVLTSSDVRYKKDHKPAKLKELLIDAISDNTLYVAVISFGSFWGKGENLSAIPWNAMGFNNTSNGFLG